jgi:hypothetical protein
MECTKNIITDFTLVDLDWLFNKYAFGMNTKYHYWIKQCSLSHSDITFFAVTLCLPQNSMGHHTSILPSSKSGILTILTPYDEMTQWFQWLGCIHSFILNKILGWISAWFFRHKHCPQPLCYYWLQHISATILYLQSEKTTACQAYAHAVS